MDESNGNESPLEGPHLPLIVFLFIILIAIPIIEQTRFGFMGWSNRFSSLVMNAGVVLGTVLLATGTWISVHEAQKERQVTQQTITEMRRDRAKPGVIMLIAYGIDQAISKLEGDKYQLQNDNSIFMSKLSLGDPVVDEIEEKYPTFSSDLETYRTDVESWDEINNGVKEDILEYLESEFIDQLRSETMDQVTAIIDEHELHESTPEQFISGESKRLLEWVIIQDKNTDREYFVDLWNVIHGDLLQIREMDRFKDRLVERERLICTSEV